MSLPCVSKSEPAIVRGYICAIIFSVNIKIKIKIKDGSMMKQTCDGLEKKAGKPLKREAR